MVHHAGMTKEVQFKLRLPADMLETIRAAAKRNGRSVTAEIVDRLEDADRLLYHLEEQDAQEEEMRGSLDREIPPEEALLLKFGVAQMQVKSLTRMLADVEEEISNVTGLRSMHFDASED